VSIFEAGVRSRGPVAFRLVDDPAVARHWRRDWGAEIRSLAPAATPRKPLRSLVGLAGQLAIPVLLLLVAGEACLLYSQMPPPVWIGGDRAMPLGLLLLPGTFFVVQLTNRRYGGVAASLQLVVASLAAVAILLLRPDWLSGLPDLHQWGTRTVLSFGMALFLAHAASVMVFDWLRGPAWWRAPFFASLAAGLVFCLLAYPFAYAGRWADWADAMTRNLAIMTVAATLLLVPYWLLRRFVEPLPGFGGY
jgi:uncharacterized PurR-regulated membrane protein YhhQ (DUF165 family)